MWNFIQTFDIGNIEYWNFTRYINIGFGTLQDTPILDIRTFISLRSLYVLMLNNSGLFLKPQILLRGPQLLGNEQPMWPILKLV